MSPRLSQRLVIDDESQVGHARRTAAEMARQHGFNDADCHNVALVTSELASNLVKHARGGELILNAIPTPTGHLLDVLSVDRGPGIADIEQSLTDGYSSYGSSGNGLGAVRRLSSVCEIFSQPSRGTVLLSRFMKPGATAPRQTDLAIGGVSIPAPGETECGDSWAHANHGSKCHVLIADGLGHGPLAAEAAHEAIRVLADHPQAEPVELLRLAHEALRATRGAALVAAELDFEQRKIRYAGVGNIAGCIHTGSRSQNMVSQNGTAGSLNPKFREFIYDFPAQSLVIFWSDGLTSHLKLDDYPGLVQFDPVVIAGVLYRDFKRGRDDATAVVAKSN